MKRAVVLTPGVVLPQSHKRLQKIGNAPEKTRDKLVAATKELDSTGVRTRTIERKLRQVQELPATESKLILDASPEDESTEEGLT